MEVALSSFSSHTLLVVVVAVAVALGPHRFAIPVREGVAWVWVWVWVRWVLVGGCWWVWAEVEVKVVSSVPPNPRSTKERNSAYQQ